MFMATMRARAAKKILSRSDSANLRADAARNTGNASSPNSARKPKMPNCPRVMAQRPSVTLISFPHSS